MYFGGDNMAVSFDLVEDPRLFHNFLSWLLQILVAIGLISSTKSRRVVLLVVLVQILLGLPYFQL